MARYRELGNAIVIRAYRDVVNWYLIRKKYPLTDRKEFGKYIPDEDYFKGYPPPHAIARAESDSRKTGEPAEHILNRRYIAFRKNRMAMYTETVRDGVCAEKWFQKNGHLKFTDADGEAILRRAEKRADELIQMGRDKENED